MTILFLILVANDVTERLRLGEEVRRRRKRAVVDPMDGMPAEDDVYPVVSIGLDKQTRGPEGPEALT